MQIRSTATPQTLRFDFASESQRQAVLSRLQPGQTREARILDNLAEGK